MGQENIRIIIITWKEISEPANKYFLPTYITHICFLDKKNETQ